MLVRAQEKARQTNGVAPIPFLEADALRLPFADGTFDLVTAAFGFRNLANYEEGLREIFRVLKRNGTLGILEFAEPPPGLLGICTVSTARKCCHKLVAGFPVTLLHTRTCQNPWRDFFAPRISLR